MSMSSTMLRNNSFRPLREAKTVFSFCTKHSEQNLRNLFKEPRIPRTLLNENYAYSWMDGYSRILQGVHEMVEIVTIKVTDILFRKVSSFSVFVAAPSDINES